MYNFFKILFLLLILSHCTLNKVVKKHGVRNLEKKHQQLIVSKTNSNDIINLLGPPSTKSNIEKDLWFYIEKEITNERILKLGKEKIIRNNVLLIKIDNRGILEHKELIDINRMNELNFSKMTTDANFNKSSFIYDFLSSMRQKINDPLGKRKKP
jgi:outer membrane protein assembly factor BamE (lipoprotein component of BamABCDE complex)